MNPFIPPRNLPLPQERMTIIPATRGGLDIDAGATPYTPPFVEAEGGPEPEEVAFPAFHMVKSGEITSIYPGRVFVQSVELLSPTQSASSVPTDPEACLRVPGLTIYQNESLVVPTIGGDPHEELTESGGGANYGQTLSCTVEGSSATYEWHSGAAPSAGATLRYYYLGELDAEGVLTQHRRSDVFHFNYTIAICDADE